jgi:hypothetical protein
MGEIGKKGDIRGLHGVSETRHRLGTVLRGSQTCHWKGIDHTDLGPRHIRLSSSPPSTWEDGVIYYDFILLQLPKEKFAAMMVCRCTLCPTAVRVAGTILGNNMDGMAHRRK